MKNVRSLFVGAGRKVLSFGLAFLGPVAMASATSAFDVTTVLAAITDAAAAIALLGAAVIAGPKIGVKAWKWLSSAL